MPTLEASVDTIVYHRPETGWTVLRIVYENGDGEHVEGTAVGTQLGHLHPGETAVFAGQWIKTTKWGLQFDCGSGKRAKNPVVKVPATVLGIQRYLAKVDGCGPATARKIVERWGDASLETVWGGAEPLLELPGVGVAQAKKIHASLLAKRKEAAASVGLGSIGVPDWLVPRVVRAHGADAEEYVRANPYRLIREFRGVGFKVADAIARAAGTPLQSPERIQAGLFHTLRDGSSDGHTFLPRGILMQKAALLLSLTRLVIEDQLAALEAEDLVVLDGEAVYLTRYHAAESYVAARLLGIHAAALPDRRPPAEPDFGELTPSPKQAEAVRACCEEKVVVLTGGPGTGKTTITDVVVRAYRAAGLRVALAAPTGRAAKRLAEATGHPASTIHRLLEYHPFYGWRRNAGEPLEHDLVLVDEVSMVDVLLMARLLDAVPDAARVVLVGDADQLPSVGAGKVLGDVIESDAVRVVELDHIFRQAAESWIVRNAHRVNSGLPLELPGPDATAAADFFMVRRHLAVADEEWMGSGGEHGRPGVRELVVELVSRVLPERRGFDPMTEIWVLTPQNVGPVGTKALNARLQQVLNPHGEPVPFAAKKYGDRKLHLRVGDRVMQFKNDYDLGVFNGDAGRVLAFDTKEELVEVEIDDKVVVYDKTALANLFLAYASTVHKMQGCEAPCVVLVAHTTHWIMLQRRLLYTGITRGRRLVVVVGQDEAIQVATKTTDRDTRHSGLGWRLAEGLAPEGSPYHHQEEGGGDPLAGIGV